MLDGADTSDVFDEVCAILGDLIDASSATDPAEIRELAENFILASLSLRSDLPARGPHFSQEHLDMLWAIFTVIDGAETVDPLQIPKSAVLAALAKSTARQSA